MTTVRPPDGRLRQSQVVSTFGPGAMVDLVNDAVLIGGLDYWGLEGAEVIVQEPRLREAIAWQFQEKKWPLSKDRPFRKPPAGNDREATQSNGIQVLEFPRWFVCQNPRCRALVRPSSLTRTNNEYRHHCLGGDGRGERAVPVRFVVACRKGHLDDINWTAWVHAGEKCASPQLRLDEGASGDFSDIEAACNGCGKKRRLIELTIKDRAMTCTGQRPWLGPEAWQRCEEKQRFLIRTASNGYFSQSTSVISIPQPLTLRDRVRSQWKILEHATKDTLGAFRTVPDVRDALGEATDEAVLQAIAEERVAKIEVEPELRTAEWLQFMASPKEQPGELPRDRREFFWARKAARPKGLPPIIDQVVIGRRLREVQAQLGFTRLDARSPDLQGRYDLNVELAQLSLQKDWVPVTEIQGEGLLITLDETRLHAWETSPALAARREVLFAAWERWREVTRSNFPFPGLRFYALHALSHLLMNQLALDCGYPASSIHERLYCAPHDAAVPMAGVLLMTGTTGAEGTLGGLVEEGKRLGRHLRRAWEGARLCSNDPVCAHHEPSALDDRHLEGAACHGCLFVPECSCERFNQYLDRALVVPTLGHEELALLGAPWWT
ncbi:MAG: DrmB family protein [Myxococcota bacterium]